MTLLALDLRVPDLGNQPADHALAHALLDQGPHYLAFLLSFYVIADYWQRHKTEMRTADAAHPALTRRTLSLLLAVCALPFAADLLGTHGTHDGVAVAVYRSHQHPRGRLVAPAPARGPPAPAPAAPKAHPTPRPVVRPRRAAPGRPVGLPVPQPRSTGPGRTHAPERAAGWTANRLRQKRTPAEEAAETADPSPAAV
ncbi:DUF1211 domain-containing protein [Streptacidiphilus sp. 4-A2]|nr:DUF1211 domain-containing protein [Streptacidiphilus sp. 4-A2]